MAGTVKVTITSTTAAREWVCGLANTYSELVQGLSGTPSLQAGTGVLFDLGTVYTSIDINMRQMNYPLDIVFIGAGNGVVGVLKNVPVGGSVPFSVSGGFRYFMEVNANEAVNVNIGDSVNISAQVGAQLNTITPQFWAGLAVAVPLVIGGVQGVVSAIKEKKPEKVFTGIGSTISDTKTAWGKAEKR